MILSRKTYNSFSVIYLIFKVSPFSATLVTIWSILDALILTMGMTLATAFFVETATEVLKQERPQKDVYLPLFILLLLLCFISTAKSIVSLINEYIILNIRRKLEPEIITKLSSLDYKHIESAKSWEIISRVFYDPVSSLMKGFSSYISLLKIILYVVSVLGLITAYVLWAAILIFVFSAPMLWFSIRAGKKNYKASCETVIFNMRTQYLNELLIGRNNVEERTLYGYGSEISRRWQEQYEVGRKLRLKVCLKQLLLTRGSSLSLSLIVVLVALTLVNPVIEGYLSTGMFMGLVGAVIGVTHNMGWSMSSALETISNTGEYMKDLTLFVNLDEISDALSEPDTETPAFSKLEFRNVRFKYPNDNKYILDGLSFKIENGKNYAFVGKNGAGKTTIIKLLTGLYPEYEGEILINNKELREYPAGTIKALFSIVYQDFAKYYISMRENIALGDISGKDSNERALSVAQLVGLDGVIANLKKGIDTPLGRIKENGQDISGGQWQRIAIARSLISRSPIKILDEPTAALDPISESRLYSEFEKLMKNKTTIFISHRLGSTKLADEILVIDNGRIIEKGTHEMLISKKGQYADMFEAQRGWYS